MDIKNKYIEINKKERRHRLFKKNESIEFNENEPYENEYNNYLFYLFIKCLIYFNLLLF